MKTLEKTKLIECISFLKKCDPVEIAKNLSIEGLPVIAYSVEHYLIMIKEYLQFAEDMSTIKGINNDLHCKTPQINEPDNYGSHILTQIFNNNITKINWSVSDLQLN